jgi:hypothetical protein
VSQASVFEEQSEVTSLLSGAEWSCPSICSAIFPAVRVAVALARATLNNQIMKYLSFLASLACAVVVSLASSVTWAASVRKPQARVEFSMNKIHSLVVFVEAISGNPHRPPALKEAFDASKFAKAPDALAKIEAFKKLDKPFNKFLDYDGPDERNNGINVRDLIVIQSGFAKDLKNLRERTLGLLPSAELNSLIAILTHFQPIYETLIWNPNEKELAKIVDAFNANGAKWKVDALFEKAVKFYKASWPSDQVFTVSFYPIPSTAKLSNGQSYGAFESVGIIIGDSNLEGKFGVVFHEMCHSLYAAETVEFQKNLSDLFMNHKSKFGRVAYTWLNESLATAIGNGWAYEKTKGKMDKTEWYHHSKIDGFSHALYPVVTKYLAAGRTLDVDFVNAAVAAFEKKFPTALDELETYMGEIILLASSDFSPMADMRRELRQQFSISSLSSSAPIEAPQILRSVAANARATLLVVVSAAELKKAAALDSVVPGFSALLAKAAASGDQFGQFEVGPRRILILILSEPARLHKAVEWMGKTKRVGKLGEFVLI